MSGPDPYPSIVENLSVPLVVVRASSGTVRYANLAAEATFGLARHALQGLPASELFQDPRQFQTLVTALSRRAQVGRHDARVRGADGTDLAMEIALDSIFYHDEAAVVVTFHDLTRLRKMEGDLRLVAQVEKLLSDLSRRFIRLAPGEIDRGLEEALEEIAGVVLADSGFLAAFDDMETRIHRLLSWRSDVLEEPAWQRILDGEIGDLLDEVKKGELTVLTSHNSQRWFGEEEPPPFSLALVPIFYHQTLHGLLGFGTSYPGRRWEGLAATLKTVAQIVANVLRRQDAEEALAAERERLAVTLGSIADGVIATDRESRIMLFNTRAEKLTGWTREQAVGRPLSEVFRRCDLSGVERGDPVGEVLQKGLVLSAESQLIAADGKVWPIEESAAPIRGPDSRILGVVVAFGDVSEKRQAELERERANKLEAVGLLAGGIAHDFRNILLVILGNASLAEYSLESPEQIKKLVHEIKNAAGRARELTEQLLTFSKGGAPVKAPVVIADLIHESVNFCLRGSNVVCEPQIAPGMWLIEADAGQISQVLNNLLINAVQSMPDGGRVELVAENASPNLVAEVGLAGRHLRVLVTDEGSGIPPENLGRIFDPYFTTKEEGTGLGLATTHSIVKNHDGALRVDSGPGEGASFEIFLPALGGIGKAGAADDEELPLGSGRVLVVDDEEPILELARGMLERLGYEAATATDGAEAIAKYQAAQDAGEGYDVVLMDLTIPGGMGGRDAVGHILDLDPDARIVVSSGYSQDPVMAHFDRYGFVDILPKPFVIVQLGQVLRRVLQDSQA